MLSPPREVAKALETDRALLPEAGEDFDFTSYLESVARVCRGEKKLCKLIKIMVIMYKRPTRSADLM